VPINRAEAPIVPHDLFQRIDESPDGLFYSNPRFVTHIDDATITALTNFYSEILFTEADVLDLMSSWISHLSAEPKLGRVAGLGLNKSELENNARLTEHCVQDLNRITTLPYQSNSFDFVFIAVSIQYLVHPFEIFSEIARLLRTDGQIVVSMSHRCFPTKAVRAFRESDLNQRISIVGQYMERARKFSVYEFIDRSPVGADPLWIVRARRRDNND